MRHKHAARRAVIWMVTLLLLLSACRNVSPGGSDGRADAYVAVFQAFIPSGAASGPDSVVIAVDLTNVLYEHPDRIQDAIKAYVEGSNVVLLWDDMDGLIKSGRIVADGSGNPLYFENGFLLVYKDIDLTETTLKTKAHKWYGNLGADGATYTVKKEGAGWAVAEIEGMWIS